MDEKIYTVEEVAKFLRVHKRGIYEEIRQGKLKAVKIGRRIIVTESALKQFIS
jgi:excisionase family DNA binding protein